MLINIALIIIGFIILIKGADYLVSGASDIAKKFHISEMVIGMTVVAMGTSLPELLVSVKSSLGGHADISLGNVIGSNLLNLLLILGICATIGKGLKIKKGVRTTDAPLNFILTFVLLIVCNIGAELFGISRFEGVFLLILFAAYIIFMLAQSKKDLDQDDGKTNVKRISISKALLHVLIGAIGLKFGADFVVDNAVDIAQIFGISEKIIAITIVALGTSLPELASSVTAVRKGETDLAIGNVLGSNIFNILLILGVASTISPINYNNSYNFDIIILFISSLLLLFFPYMGKKNVMTRREGLLYILIYIIYMFILLIIR